jgi:hypothetical protein
MKRFFLCLIFLLIANPALAKVDIDGNPKNTTQREALIERSLERKNWSQSTRVVRISIIVGKYIVENRFGWTGRQWEALKALWGHESGWKWWNVNPSSGACGIPQFHPCSKGKGDFNTNPVTQIRQGAFLIEGKYSTPVGACRGNCNSGTY